MNIENKHIWQKATKAVSKYELQPLKITGGWKIEWNHFMAIDPLQLSDDDLAWIDFSENLAAFTYRKYDITLGWYGRLDKNGYYGVSIFKNKILIETFDSQDIRKITDVINYFFTIPFQTKP